jgi:hypothetical protein
MPEHRKPVVDKGRWLDLARCLVHFIPLSGANAILHLNFSSYYVGPSFEQASKLQFAAKVLQLLMLVSLTAILTSLIRSKLISTGIPFGFLFVPLQISYL